MMKRVFSPAQAVFQRGKAASAIDPEQGLEIPVPVFPPQKARVVSGNGFCQRPRRPGFAEGQIDPVRNTVSAPSG
jgi:hypothetical protein